MSVRPEQSDSEVSSGPTRWWDESEWAEEPPPAVTLELAPPDSEDRLPDDTFDIESHSEEEPDGDAATDQRGEPAVSRWIADLKKSCLEVGMDEANAEFFITCAERGFPRLDALQRSSIGTTPTRSGQSVLHAAAIGLEGWAEEEGEWGSAGPAAMALAHLRCSPTYDSGRLGPSGVVMDGRIEVYGGGSEPRVKKGYFDQDLRGRNNLGYLTGRVLYKSGMTSLAQMHLTTRLDAQQAVATGNARYLLIAKAQCDPRVALEYAHTLRGGVRRKLLKLGRRATTGLSMDVEAIRRSAKVQREMMELLQSADSLLSPWAAYYIAENVTSLQEMRT